MQILGQSVASDAVRSVLSRYSPLTAEVDDLAPSEGLPRDHYLANVDAGICIRHGDDGRIACIFLHAEGHEGYSGFQGGLGDGLDFSASPAAVRDALGPPSFCRDQVCSPVLGPVGGMLQYTYPSHTVSFQFNVGGQEIELVVLSASESEG